MNAILSSIQLQYERDAVKNLVVPVTSSQHSLNTIQSKLEVSTIEKMSFQEEVLPLRPKLPKPVVKYQESNQVQKKLDQITSLLKNATTKEHYVRIIIDLHNAMEEVSSKHLKLISDQIRRDSKKLEELNLKKTEELKKFAEKVKDDETWGFYGTVAEYFNYALSIATGAALITTGVGVVAGSFLIAAGGLGLGGRILDDTGAWDSIISYFVHSRTMQENISQMISSSLFFLSIGLGLIGGVHGLQTGSLRNLTQAVGAEKTIEQLSTIASITTAGMKTKIERNAKERQNTSARLTLIDGKLSLMQHFLQKASIEAKKNIDTIKTLTKLTKDAISAHS
jgi:hypothetical protein